MTDLEITKLCAEAMEIEVSRAEGGWFLQYEGDGSEGPEYSHQYDPLHDDAQKWAIAEKFPHAMKAAIERHFDRTLRYETSDLGRHLCECVAKM